MIILSRQRLVGGGFEQTPEVLLMPQSHPTSQFKTNKTQGFPKSRNLVKEKVKNISTAVYNSAIPKF